MDISFIIDAVKDLANILVERTDMFQSESGRAVDNALADYESLCHDVDEFVEGEEKAREQREIVTEAGTKAVG